MSAGGCSDQDFAAVSMPMQRQSALCSQVTAQDLCHESHTSHQIPSSSSSVEDSGSGLVSAPLRPSPFAGPTPAPAQNSSTASGSEAPCLFAFPLESNFSGARYDPALVNQIQSKGVHVACYRTAAAQASHEEEDVQQVHQPHNRGEEQPSGLKLTQEGRQAQQEQTEEEQRCAQQQVVTEQEAMQLDQHSQEEEGVQPGQHSQKEEDARMRRERPVQSDGDRWHVLIDAAKACATAPPDLTKHPADFVVSFITSPLQ